MYYCKNVILKNCKKNRSSVAILNKNGDLLQNRIWYPIKGSRKMCMCENYLFQEESIFNYCVFRNIGSNGLYLLQNFKFGTIHTHKQFNGSMNNDFVVGQYTIHPPVVTDLKNKLQKYGILRIFHNDSNIHVLDSRGSPFIL